MANVRTITYREAINEALREEMDRDEQVLLLGEDVGIFGGAMAVTKGLYESFAITESREFLRSLVR